MGKLFDRLMEDIRFEEGLKACMNCGVCTAICPAAEFYRYDPRIIVDTLQTRDEDKIEALLKSDTIWYCGQCMSCKMRCPRGNAPGLMIMALRLLSQQMGYFTESEKGRQQFAIKRTVGENILAYGYCVYPDHVSPELHPEQGPVWEWVHQHLPEVYDRLGGNYKKDGPGIFRKIPEESLDELRNIFRITGGKDLYECIEKYSEKKAKDMGLEFGEGTGSEYFFHTYSYNSNTHEGEP